MEIGDFNEKNCKCNFNFCYDVIYDNDGGGS